MKAFSRIAVLLCLTPLAAAQTGDDSIAKIIDIGKNHSQVDKELWWLCYKIGARLTSSPELQSAEDWAVASLKSWGVDNAHLEKWDDAPVGFHRGATQVAKMTAPFERNMQFSSNAWTNGTNGPEEGPAIKAPLTMDDFNKVKDQLKGAWIVYPNSTYAPRAKGTEPQEVADAVDAAGILGRVWYSGGEGVHTDGRWGIKTFENHPGLPSFIIRKSDMNELVKVWDQGKTPRLMFNAENLWTKGPVPQYNVVGEIRGTEKPDEVVIFGGHIDSWNGPGSQGASDNGTGAITALEAMRILKMSGVKPKRTIRVVLWSGEEQGLFGSRGYVETHKDEMDKISVVLVDDGGSDYQGGYIGPEEYKATMEAAYAPTVAAWPQYPEQYKVVKSISNQERGSDHASFWKYHVPAFFTIETGKQNYGKVHHTQFDVFNEAYLEYLPQSSTNHAVVAYQIANLPDLLPRTK